MKLKMKILIITVLALLAVLIGASNVKAAEGIASMNVVDKNGKEMTYIPPESGGPTALLNTDKDYTNCNYIMYVDNNYGEKIETDFGTFTFKETTQNGYIYTCPVKVSDIADKKSGAYDLTFKATNTNTQEVDTITATFIFYKVGFKSNANLKVGNEYIIKNGKIVKATINNDNYYAYYYEHNNTLNLKKYNDKNVDISYSNMGDTFNIESFGDNSYTVTNNSTEETLQQMINVLPDNININLKESEYEKASAEVEKQVKAIWQEKGIDTTGVEVFVDGGEALYLAGTKEGFYNFTINLRTKPNTSPEKYKNISITYNNSKNHSKNDENYVNNLNIEIPKYFEIDISKIQDVNLLQLTQEYYSKFIESSFLVKIDAGSGDGGINPLIAHSGAEVGFFKNDMLYDIRNTGTVWGIPVIIVPNSVKESETNNYVINKLKENFDFLKEVKTINKGATISGSVRLDGNKYENWTKEIIDGYTVKYIDDYGEGESYIIVRREQSTQIPVTKTDTSTNIQLESNTDIVPSDTVLEVKPIEKSNITVDNVSNFVAYDITLKSNGVEIQPNGKVKIKIPVPEGFDTSKLIVYRIDENNKVKYDVKVEMIDNKKYATFETDHFSTYVLGELKQGTINTEGEKDETPKTGTTDIIKYMIPVAIISGFGIIALRRKETK